MTLGMSGLRRSLALLLVGLTAQGLSGCGLEPGESVIDAELARVKAKNGFAVLSANVRKAEIAAQGKRIRIEPAPGLCIAEDSISVARGGAFAMIADCLPEARVQPAVGTPASETTASETATPAAPAPDLALPPSFAGVVTVSIAGARGFEGSSTSREWLDGMESFIATPEGLQLIGRGGTPESVQIENVLRIDDALYLLVEDHAQDGLDLFAPRFWRAFVRLNERMLLVTVNGFAARPVTEDEMMSVLALQMSHLREANGGAASERELRLARRAEPELRGLGTDEALAVNAPKASPVPPRREGESEDETTVIVSLNAKILPESARPGLTYGDELESAASLDAVTGQGGPVEAPLTGTGTKWAPSFSPPAPRRPG